jgi:hypothetical protein
VEFKSRPSVSGADLSGLRAFREDWPEVPCLLVCTAPESFRWTSRKSFHGGSTWFESRISGEPYP